MTITSEHPFQVGTLLWQDSEKRSKLTVVVKVTSDIKDGGQAVVSAKQLPLFTGDVLFDKDDCASVRFESDMVPTKPRTDVVLLGKAYAPNGEAVRSLNVGLQVGGLQRRIRVFGDRQWRFLSQFLFFPTISRPKPFVTMDLVYERAFGGIDKNAARYCKENLIGRGFIGKKSTKSIHGKPLPNLEDPDHLIRSWRSKPKPVGFGFYGRGWMPRLKQAGTYDDNYRKRRAPLPPLDFSSSFFNGAHPDLQLAGYLKGDETVEMINMNAKGRLKFRLPGIQPKINVTKWKVSPEVWLAQMSGENQDASLDNVPVSEEPVQAVLDTLVLIPDEGIFYQVFRGVCPISSLEQAEVVRINVRT